MKVSILCQVMLISALTKWKADSTLCDARKRRGPFTLNVSSYKSQAPSKQMIMVERARVVKDAELAIMFRSYWSSYCYNGGDLDRNTGCFNNIRQEQPDRREALEWIQNGKCRVYSECRDCWGSDAEMCLKPKLSDEKWVTEQELKKAVSNNHFAYHTCNLSWRCGLHKTMFPTFLFWEGGSWSTYTTFDNGTTFGLKNKDFWQLDDITIYKTEEPEIVEDKVELPCFEVKDKPISCYDRELGNFVEFTEDWTCLAKTCYLNPTEKRSNRKSGTTAANLKAAGIEDLKMVIAYEQMINEELRYNFGLLMKEVQELRNILTKAIMSTAKIDDKLIGSVLGQAARSKFVGENQFFLEPCMKPEPVNSNCAGLFVYKDGRWTEKGELTECTEISNSTSILLFEKDELWLPEIRQGEFLGTAKDFEGWSYVAKEKENMDRAMKWTRNAQSTTSIGDLYNYPKGLFNYSVMGFVMAHLGVIAVLAAVLWFVCRKRRQQAATTTVALHQSFELEQSRHAEGSARDSSCRSPEELPAEHSSVELKGFWDRKDLV